MWHAELVLESTMYRMSELNKVLHTPGKFYTPPTALEAVAIPQNHTCCDGKANAS